MGRWDAGTGVRFPNIRRSYIRIAKYVIIAGFTIVAVVILSANSSSQGCCIVAMQKYLRLDSDSKPRRSGAKYIGFRN